MQSEWHGHFHSFPRGGSGANIPVHTTALAQTSFSYSANENAKCLQEPYGELRTTDQINTWLLGSVIFTTAKAP